MGKFFAWALVVSFLLAGVISYFASPSPDGLEKVAEDRGFVHKAEGQGKGIPVMPDYGIPGIKNAFLRGGLAGVIGTALVFGLVYWIGKGVRKRDT